jgi:uncharacterized membrane protein YidH (DUF202 family)
VVTTLAWRRTALGFFAAVPLIAVVGDRANLQQTAEALVEANYAFVAATKVALGLAIWPCGAGESAV